MSSCPNHNLKNSHNLVTPIQFHILLHFEIPQAAKCASFVFSRLDFNIFRRGVPHSYPSQFPTVRPLLFFWFWVVPLFLGFPFPFRKMDLPSCRVGILSSSTPSFANSLPSFSLPIAWNSFAKVSICLDTCLYFLDLSIIAPPQVILFNFFPRLTSFFRSFLSFTSCVFTYIFSFYLIRHFFTIVQFR